MATRARRPTWIAWFRSFGEYTDDRRRAWQMDEALNVIGGQWTAEPFSYDGEFYQVRGVTLLPGPVQKPRIPIWVGGGYPNPGPTARAARWDGSLLYRQTHGESWLDMLPEDVANLKAYVRQQRADTTPTDIAIGGRERGEDWEREREYLGQIAQADAIWWIEAIPPIDLSTMRAWIRRGPLRTNE